MAPYLSHAPQKMPRKGIFVACETCKAEFYVYPSRAKQAAKNGFAIRFCSQACYKKTGDKNPMYGRKHTKESIEKFKAHPNRQIFKMGLENPNFVRFGSDFDPKSFYRLRMKLAEKLGACQRCGFNEVSEILQLHHKDRNRKNNAIENVELLCPNCHQLEHYRAKDGPYHPQKGKNHIAAKRRLMAALSQGLQ